MLRSPYRYISITLATGEVRTLPIYAPFVRLLDNSIAVDPEISIDGSFETFPAGLSLKLPSSENFTEISVRNPDVNPMTLVFAFASEEVTDTRLTLSGSTFTDILNELQGDLVPENWGADTAVGLAAVQLFAANAARNPPRNQAKPGPAPAAPAQPIGLRLRLRPAAPDDTGSFSTYLLIETNVPAGRVNDPAVMRRARWQFQAVSGEPVGIGGAELLAVADTSKGPSGLSRTSSAASFWASLPGVSSIRGSGYAGSIPYYDPQQKTQLLLIVHPRLVQR